MNKKYKKQFIDSNSLPERYNSTDFTLIARDPQTIHAYWSISDKDLKSLYDKFGDLFDDNSFFIRMYDVTLVDFNGSNANNSFDINIDLSAKSWYISLWSDNVTYCGELGVKTFDENFHVLARSNFVTTPRSFLSDKTDLTWMEVKEDSKEDIQISYEVPEKTVQVTGKPAPKKVVKKDKKGKKEWIPLTPEEIRAYYAKLFPLLRGIRKTGTDDKIRAKARKLQGLYSNNFLLSGLTLGEFYKRILLGSSAEMVLKEKAESGGASEQLLGGASEQNIKDRKFFFEIGTELIVYGRTEPDAKVKLGDKEIKLREDGTFTLRFALPDGKIPLDFIATSADEVDERSISTSVERSKTKYKP